MFADCFGNCINKEIKKRCRSYRDLKENLPGLDYLAPDVVRRRKLQRKICFYIYNMVVGSDVCLRWDAPNLLILHIIA